MRPIEVTTNRSVRPLLLCAVLLFFLARVSKVSITAALGVALKPARFCAVVTIGEIFSSRNQPRNSVFITARSFIAMNIAPTCRRIGRKETPVYGSNSKQREKHP